MVGRRKAGSIVRPLARLNRRHIETRIGEIERIDPEAHRVWVAGEPIVADYIVVSLGADLAPETIPGLAEAGHNFYTTAGAAAFAEALGTFTAGRVVVLTAAPAYKCPAAPYEAAMLIDDACRRRGTRRHIPIDVFAAEAAPMGVAGPEVSQGVRQLLEARDIAYHPEHQVTSVDQVTKRLRFANGMTAGFDLLAYVPPHRAPRAVRESPLVGEAGWITVDRHTLATRFPGVYAIGDVVSIPLALGKPLPKAGVFANAEADVVAWNIARTIAPRGNPARFTGHGECFVEVGGGRAAFGAGDFYAEPTPIVHLYPPTRFRHISKVLLEQSWLRLTLS
jgi:sulfide:quinone oxidoreductase